MIVVRFGTKPGAASVVHMYKRINQGSYQSASRAIKDSTLQ